METSTEFGFALADLHGIKAAPDQQHRLLGPLDVLAQRTLRRLTVRSVGQLADQRGPVECDAPAGLEKIRQRADLGFVGLKIAIPKNLHCPHCLPSL